MEATKVIDRYSAYRFFRSFPDLEAIDFEGVFDDTGSLPVGIFGWLQGIRLSHFVAPQRSYL